MGFEKVSSEIELSVVELPDGDVGIFIEYAQPESRLVFVALPVRLLFDEGRDTAEIDPQPTIRIPRKLGVELLTGLNVRIKGRPLNNRGPGVASDVHGDESTVPASGPAGPIS